MSSGLSLCQLALKGASNCLPSSSCFRVELVAGECFEEELHLILDFLGVGDQIGALLVVHT